MRGAELLGCPVHTVGALWGLSRLAVAARRGAGALCGAVCRVGAVPLVWSRACTRRSRSAGADRGHLARVVVRPLHATSRACTVAGAGGAEGERAAAQRLDARRCRADAQSSPRKRSVARRSAFVGRPAPRPRTATRSSLGGGGGE